MMGKRGALPALPLAAAIVLQLGAAGLAVRHAFTVRPGPLVALPAAPARVSLPTLGAGPVAPHRPDPAVLALRRTFRLDAGRATGAADRVVRLAASGRFLPTHGRRAQARALGEALALTRFAEAQTAATAALVAAHPQLAPTAPAVGQLAAALVVLAGRLPTASVPDTDIVAVRQATAALRAAAGRLRLHVVDRRPPALAQVPLTLPPDPAALRAAAARRAARAAVRRDLDQTLGAVHRYLDVPWGKSLFASTRSATALATVEHRALIGCSYALTELRAAPAVTAALTSAERVLAGTLVQLIDRLNAGRPPTAAMMQAVDESVRTVLRSAAADRLTLRAGRVPTFS